MTIDYSSKMFPTNGHNIERVLEIRHHLKNAQQNKIYVALNIINVSKFISWQYKNTQPINVTSFGLLEDQIVFSKISIFHIFIFIDCFLNCTESKKCFLQMLICDKKSGL